MEAKHASEKRNIATISIVILVVGAVAALALGIGGVWLARTGILVSVAAGSLALLIAFRLLRESRLAAVQASVDAAQAAALAERRHHHESMGIIERFTRRVTELRAQIDTLSAELSDARAQLAERDLLVSSLRSTQESLLTNAADMRNRVVALEEQLALRELELREVLDHGTVADILALPTRPQLAARAEAVDELVIWDEAVGH